jgi:hypothetical protein
MSPGLLQRFGYEQKNPKKGRPAKAIKARTAQERLVPSREGGGVCDRYRVGAASALDNLS